MVCYGMVRYGVVLHRVWYGMQPRTENVLGWLLLRCWFSARNLLMEQSPCAMSITAYMVWCDFVWFCMVWYGVVLYCKEQEGSPWNSPQVHRSKKHPATSLPISTTHLLPSVSLTYHQNISLTRSQCLTLQTYPISHTPHLPAVSYKHIYPVSNTTSTNLAKTLRYHTLL